ncbi:uncharacterized protein A1O9_07524 [Exophiala aquamarina CBS 119918]|uniref:Uncharacterized protein n=1 Tax=Exophiala aquamarina CBS 119918 TaxID=1182545 RepID=A0A072P753_9EURO|nr:uncharacterized protein A1O9_07524 [Exophiala aquamarina CBS 119918]KEF55944.1 hypothetical protein A1O9_07524 [Exophiala aquamarina CBS 119918]
MAAACRQKQNVVPQQRPSMHAVQEIRLVQIHITKCAALQGIVPQQSFRIPYVVTDLGTFITTAVWTRATSVAYQHPLASTSSSAAPTSITSAVSSTYVFSSATSNLAPSTTSDGSALPTNTSSSSSSSGPIIGGAVAGVVGVVLLAAVGFFIYRKRRRTNQNKAQSNTHDTYYEHHPNNKSDYQEVVELSDSYVVELPSSEQLTPQLQKPKQHPVELA